MHLDVCALRDFYYGSALGRAAQGAIREQIAELWPEAKGQTVTGFGFAVPMLRPFLSDARRVIALMPGPQGVMPWPRGAPNVSVLTEEMHWPIETGHIDKLIVMHGLETSEQPSELLKECYRTLGPGGRALFVVPNRAGLWSRSDRTPFGFGRPYTLSQLEAQLRQHAFQPGRHVAALYQPPSQSRFWRKVGPFCEKTGRSLHTVLAGGVLIVEAAKQVPAPRGTKVKETALNPIEVLEGLTQPSPKPAMRMPGIAKRRQLAWKNL